MMIVGVPKEIKTLEFRVALTPAGVRELVKNGHQVLIEKGAGDGSAISDAQYLAEGAEIVSDANTVWSTASMILKVKEPLPTEYPLMKKDQILFTYLHLAASKECTDALIKAGNVAIAYETVEVDTCADVGSCRSTFNPSRGGGTSKSEWWSRRSTWRSSGCETRQSGRDWWRCRGVKCSGNG
jgi:alanine dehydrogenase